ncbi:MAG: hypothetical protein RL033_1184 [Pseudomonadota bacterium]
MTMKHHRGTPSPGPSRSPSRSCSSACLRRLTGVATVLALASLSEWARADDWGKDGQPEPAAPAARAQDSRSGWSVGTALHTPLSLGILSEDEINQAALLMTGLDAELSLGGRVGYSSRLGYELAAGVRGTLGVLHRYRVEPGDPDVTASLADSLTYLLPLGICFDWLPASPSGWFGSVHLGAGTFSAPGFMSSGNLPLAGRAALDIGWVMPLDTGSLTLSARYSLLGLKTLYIDEAYNNVLQLNELSFGVGWLL